MRKIFFTFCILSAAIATNAQVVIDPSFGNGGIVQTSFGYHGLADQNTCKQVLLIPSGSFYLVFEYRDQTFLVRRLPNGALDSTYGDNGYSAGAFVRNAHAVLMPDASVLIGGSSFGIDLNWNFTLMRFLPNGKLDKSFAQNGIQLTDFYGEHDLMYAMALQPDNKIVTLGLSGSHFGVARYLPNGMLDNSFSEDGKDTLNFGGLREVPSAIAIKNDGKIIMVGQAVFGPENRMAVGCYLPDGTRDNSFSGDGMNTFNFSDDCGANAVAVQSNGKIVMAGYINKTYNEFAVVQLNADGSPDNSFSNDGVQTVYFTGWDEALAVTIDNNGKIVAGGYGGNQWLLTRLHTDGSLDVSMNGNGRANIQIGLWNNSLYSLAIQPDGKILAGGEAGFVMLQYAAARFNADGSPDYTFGNGAYIADYKPSSGVSYTASAVQPDGKLIAVGNTRTEGEISNVCIARYNINGTLDNSFSGDGKLLFRFGTGSSNAATMVIQPDGRILIGGSYHTDRDAATYKDIDFAVVRLNSDGSFDSTFSLGGIVHTNVGGMDYINSIYLQPDGKIICGGATDIGSPQGNTNTDFALVRYNADGSIDHSFGNDGIVLSGLTTTDEYINEILLQPDGKIIAAGILVSSSDAMEVDFAVARYNANGKPDLSFNGTGMRTTSIGNSDICNAAALDANGAILLAGNTYEGSGAQVTMVRVLPNGQIDNRFSGDGAMTYGTNVICNALAIQPNGQIIAGGSKFLYPDHDAMIVRFNNDGSIDSTFSPDGIISTDLGESEVLNSLSIFNKRLYGIGQSSYDGSTGLVIAYSFNPLTEICNFKDDDGDGEIDEGCHVFYQDSDGDGYGLWHIQIRATTPPAGYSTIGGDCDDGNAAIHPGSIEVCNFNDDNCNGHVDEGCQVFYRDSDGDGYGLWHVQMRAIARPDGYSTIGGDCDDTNANIRPGATELCNGINDDCDGLTDEGCPGSNANMRADQKEAIIVVDLSITAYPNPTNKFFTVRIEGDRKQGKVNLRIANHLGELKEIRNSLEVGQTIQLGDKYPAGMYFIEATQGNNKKVIKAVKL